MNYPINDHLKDDFPLFTTNLRCFLKFPKNWMLRMDDARVRCTCELMGEVVFFVHLPSWRTFFCEGSCLQNKCDGLLNNLDCWSFSFGKWLLIIWRNSLMNNQITLMNNQSPLLNNPQASANNRICTRGGDFSPTSVVVGCFSFSYLNASDPHSKARPLYYCYLSLIHI